MIAAWGRFGLKVPVAFVLSMISGIILRQFFHKDSDEAFPWQLFMLFPMFVPLGMPLWLVPFSLLTAWMIAVYSFGGYGKHIFNPVALALVLLLAGYGSSVSLLPSKPFQGATSAFSVWTAGINPVNASVNAQLNEPVTNITQFMVGGNRPSIPGLAFPGWLLLATLFIGLFFRENRWWLFSAFCSLTVSAMIIKHFFPETVAGGHSLFFIGCVPAFCMVMLADARGFCGGFVAQTTHAGIFSICVAVFAVFSGNVLNVAFAVLLAQIISPFILDVTGFGEKIEEP
ncbi:MAG: hypothetical protein Kow0029_29980 [Candidatus Rifleibacteriota bacterium]